MTEPATRLSSAELDALNRAASPTAHIARVDARDDGRVLVERFRLGNGLEVIIWEDHAAPVFAYQTWFRVGSRHDPEGRSGIAHLFEHLMFKATTTRGEGEYDRLMEAAGGQTNAATWVDWTYYKAKLPKWELDLVTTLEADRMERLALSSDMLEREREVVLNERSMRVDNDPDGRLSEALYRTAFEVHPYGVPTIGWEADIRRISLDDCMSFYRTHYAPSNAVITVVGDVSTQAVLAAIQARYGHLTAEPLPPETLRPEPPQTAPRHLELTLPLSSARVVKAWHGPASGTPEHAALEVLCEILVGGDSSRLEVALVEEGELATDVTGWVSSWAHPGLLEFSLTLRPGVAPADAEAALEAVLDDIRSGRAPITAAELDKARNSLEASFYRGLADVGSRARQLGHGAVTLGDWQDLWSEAQRLGAVTLDELARVFAETFVADRLTTAFALPSGEVPAEEDVDDGSGDHDEDGDDAGEGYDEAAPGRDDASEEGIR